MLEHALARDEASHESALTAEEQAERLRDKELLAAAQEGTGSPAAGAVEPGERDIPNPTISMISFSHAPCMLLATRPQGGRILVNVLQYAAEQGNAEEDAIAKGMAETSRESAKAGAEMYSEA